MKARNENKSPDINLNGNFDALSLEFENGSFYGLEYILEDFFQGTTIKSSSPIRPSVDWFGLYS